MERLKNLIYDKSDLIVALTIVLVSIIVINVKMAQIMDYPNYIAQQDAKSQTKKTNDNFGLAVPITDGKNMDLNNSKNTVGDATSSNQGNSGTAQVETPEIYAVYINPGETIQSIAEKFVSIGMFESTEEFIRLAEEMQATTSIKYGNFNIPSGATKKEVISRLIVAPTNY